MTYNPHSYSVEYSVDYGKTWQHWGSYDIKSEIDEAIANARLRYFGCKIRTIGDRNRNLDRFRTDS